MVSLQSIIWGFFLNNFSRVINLLLTKFAWDRPERILALGLFCTDLAALGPYCQDLGPIFSQYDPRAWLIRYMYFSVLSKSLLRNYLNFFQFRFNYQGNVTKSITIVTKMLSLRTSNFQGASIRPRNVRDITLH